MEKSFEPSFKSTDSEIYKLYLYLQQIRYETDAKISQMQKQLNVIKQIVKGGE